MKWLLLILMFFPQIAAARESERRDGEENRRLVTARVDSIKLVALDPTPGMAVASNKFQVVLSDMQVIHGNPHGIKGKIKVILFSDDLFEIKQAGQVALIVEYNSKRDFKVLNWRPIRQLACFPSQDVDKNFENYYWEDKWGGQEKCVFLMRDIYEKGGP